MDKNSFKFNAQMRCENNTYIFVRLDANYFPFFLFLMVFLLSLPPFVLLKKQDEKLGKKIFLQDNLSNKTIFYRRL